VPNENMEIQKEMTTKYMTRELGPSFRQLLLAPNQLFLFHPMNFLKSHYALVFVKHFGYKHP